MKTLFIKSDSRIHKRNYWKNSYYAFVPYQTNFGELCGFADDIVMARQGFGMHRHENMEISTIVVEGAQDHKDNSGSFGTIGINSIQTMSAGTGIMHSEFNSSKTKSFHSYQIWIYPKEINIKPRYEQFTYKQEDKKDKILLTLSPDRRNNSAFINQDAFFSVSRLSQETRIKYIMNKKGNGVYIHCVQGSIEIENFQLNDGDALGIYETDEIEIKSNLDSELIFVEVPMNQKVIVS